MKNTFERMPEFITSDVRVKRPVDVSYRIDADFMTKRHEAMLPESLVEGKSVLDLGCAVAATGAWVLDHDAKFYAGVELQPKMAYDACVNLEKYFEPPRWKILEKSIEDVISLSPAGYDIIVVSGVIYVIVNYFGFIEKLTHIADCIVIESMHPWKLIDQNNAMTDMSVWEQCIQLPIVQYTEKIRHSHEDGTKSYEYDGVRISISAFQQIFGHLGWKVSLTVNEELSRTIPDVYDVQTVVHQDPNNPGDAHLVNTASGPRFVIQCFKDEQPTRRDFNHIYGKENVSFKEWK